MCKVANFLISLTALGALFLKLTPCNCNVSKRFEGRGWKLESVSDGIGFSEHFEIASLASVGLNGEVHLDIWDGVLSTVCWEGWDFGDRTLPDSFLQ